MVVQVVSGRPHRGLYDPLYQSAAAAVISAAPTHTAQQMLLPFAKVQPQLVLNVRRQFLTVHLEIEPEITKSLIFH